LKNIKYIKNEKFQVIKFTVSFNVFAIILNDSALAVAILFNAWASPSAWFICSNWMASETNIFDFFSPSALLFAAYLNPSDSRIAARLFLSASTCICIASCTLFDNLTSRIS
jgi:hypothetical protein